MRFGCKFTSEVAAISRESVAARLKDITTNGQSTKAQVLGSLRFTSDGMKNLMFHRATQVWTPHVRGGHCQRPIYRNTSGADVQGIEFILRSCSRRSPTSRAENRRPSSSRDFWRMDDGLRIWAGGSGFFWLTSPSTGHNFSESKHTGCGELTLLRSRMGSQEMHLVKERACHNKR